MSLLDPGAPVAALRCGKRLATASPEVSPTLATLTELAALSPTTIGEALVCMRKGLDHFHRREDWRAVFLHAYYIITRNVGDTIEEQGWRSDRLFCDPEWMSRLAGKFATLYFRSLTTFDRPVGEERAWKLAHGMAMERRSTVVQDMLLGINAHIGYDLAQALASNIREHGDEALAGRLALRKHDHDQANRILMRSIAEIWRVLPRAYGGLLPIIDALSLRLNRYVAREALRRYRERVWWHAVELLEASTREDTRAVLKAMNDESMRIAEAIALQRWPLLVRLNRLLARLRKRSFRDLVTG